MTPTGTVVKVRLLRTGVVVGEESTTEPLLRERIVVPGATPVPLTHMPGERFVVPARASAEVPLAPRAS